MSDNTAIVINGWTLYTHPLFVEQYELLEKKVIPLKAKEPVDHIKKNATKRLAAIHKLGQFLQENAVPTHVFSLVVVTFPD